MLAFGHYGRTAAEQKAHTHDIGNLSFGIKYRPHLYAILLAQGGLRRLPQLNELRNRNYEILERELRDCDGVSVIDTYEGSRRGGLLEFILRVDPERLGNWSRGAFAEAAAAEGVPIVVDRYGPLHHQPMFYWAPAWLTSHDAPADNEGTAPRPELPITDATCTEFLSLPPFTKVNPQFVSQCGQALKKVATWASRISDYRTGR